MLNIVIPMAGLGSRFAKVGYTDPKPLIPVHGIPMIKLVLENLKPIQEHRFIIICQRQHVQDYDLATKLSIWCPNVELVLLDGLTEGAACTVLAAKDLINNNDPLMIANCDQYIDANINHYLAEIDNRHLDGMIMTMTADDPKWSFAALNDEQLVTQVAEKKVISNEATVGIYNFSHGYDFVSAAEAMIADNERVNNEFYVAPVYNRLVTNKKIGIWNIGGEGQGMYGLGIPADLDYFLALSLSKDVTSRIEL
ncbi:glycosyltransferase family 2 protein [Agitococcus lubricus]|uniref:MobA-like NTP transferase protein n=1 Tax=Agitococcus lubricus TaxID=1077255 RepID=A0A2T5J0Z4_9GAMM|nr:glycosyltransferase family 2 protein [Agitococcus lubricus]PTQ90043.1 MobA-like NTP transferase protein [Agitococcus lubricus]